MFEEDSTHPKVGLVVIEEQEQRQADNKQQYPNHNLDSEGMFEGSISHGRLLCADRKGADCQRNEHHATSSHDDRRKALTTALYETHVQRSDENGYDEADTDRVVCGQEVVLVVEIAITQQPFFQSGVDWKAKQAQASFFELTVVDVHKELRVAVAFTAKRASRSTTEVRVGGSWTLVHAETFCLSRIDSVQGPQAM